MSAYLAELSAAVAVEQAQRAEKERTLTQAARERLSPLQGRLARLLATIPLEVQRDGLSLHQLQVSLRGRWRGNCHPGELGAALRNLGFRRERRWSGGSDFGARWYPTRLDE